MARLVPKTHHLLTEEIINLLNSNSIYTDRDFLDSDTKQIGNVTSLTHKDVLLLKNHIINKKAAVTRNGLDYYRELIKKSALIQTRINSIDEMLGGGLMTGNLFELCGLASSGKTLFCLTLAKNVVQNLSQSVYYVDTKRDFSAHKIKMMLQDASEKEIASILSNILVKQINTKHELINSLYAIKNEMASGLKVRLIIIDSFTALFATTDYMENNVIINEVANILHYLSAEYYTVFVITNLITTWNEGQFQQQNITETVACGKFWHSIPHTRLKIEQQEDVFQFTILKSNKFPINNSCSTKIHN